MKGLLRTILSLAIVAFVAAGFNTIALAADGGLDTTFGVGGRALVDFDGNPTPGLADQDNGLDMVIQADGKIIIVGESNIGGGDSVMSATRLNADGTLDTTFANGGRFMHNATVGVAERAYGVAVQPDGKILIAGRDGSPRNRIVIRLNPDGTFDTTFGGNGVFKKTLGSTMFDEPEIALQPDGKIIVTGATRTGGLANDAFSVIRLTANGIADTTFDGDGEAVTVFQANDRAYGVELQSDGKIVVSGGTNNNAGMAIARYNTDGSLDAAFGTAGKMNVNYPSSSTLMYDLTILPGGKIIGVGYIRGQHSDAALVRFNANGTLDTTFGNNGTARFGNTSDEIFWDMQIKNNKMIAVGNRALSDPSGIDDFMMVRFSLDGVLDTTFGTNGVIYTDFSGNREIAFSAAFQSDRKLVIAGYSTPAASFNPDFAAVRYNFIPTDAVVDLDGDGRTDLANMRASGIGANYEWWTRKSSDGSVSNFTFGVRPRDVPVPADYDGDGKDDIAVWRNSPQTGELSSFYIIKSSTGSIDIIPFGQTGDTPVVEDYDGDGIDDLSVYRVPTAAQGPGQGTWFVRYSANNPANNITYIPWGMRYGTQADQADEPYPGDFDGDGKADFTLQRRQDISVVSSETPAMFITLTSAGSVRYEYFGLFGDRILPGDYDGDGKTDICVARGFNVTPGNTTWYIRYSSGIADYQTIFGMGFNFAQGDYDGDGKTDIAYMLTNATPGSTGYWYQASSINNQTRFIAWGSAPSGVGAIEMPVAGYNNR